MPYEEATRHRPSGLIANFYLEDLSRSREFQEWRKRMKHVIKATEQPWEDSPHGRIRWLLHERMPDAPIKDIELYILEIPPGGRSSRQRHTAEKYCYVLEGQGYDLHWDLELVAEGDQLVWKMPDRPGMYPWEEGDLIYIPPATIHQHFNTGDKVARLLCGMSTIYKVLGFEDLEDLGP